MVGFRTCAGSAAGVASGGGGGAGGLVQEVQQVWLLEVEVVEAGLVGLEVGQV